MKNENIGVKLHKDRDEILNFCKKFDRIHVFGNDICTSFLCRYLEEEKIVIEDTIVKNGDKKEKCFEGKYSVYELSEKSFSEQDGIIIAVKKEFQSEIKEILLKYGITSNCIYSQSIYYQYKENDVQKDSLLGDLGKDKSTYLKQYTELDKIGCKCDTDKNSQYHNYLDKYEFFLKPWKDTATKVLELGVLKGASINMWSEYFKNATVYGVDINVECKQYEGERVKVIIKDLGDEVGLVQLGKLHPQIIIDDASHLWSHQIKALYHLFPYLENGGVYILEDLGTSFYSYRNKKFGDACISAYDFCSAIAEVVCSNEFLRTQYLQANLMPLKNEIEYLASQIEMITFIHESCIMIKK